MEIKESTDKKKIIYNIIKSGSERRRSKAGKEERKKNTHTH